MKDILYADETLMLGDEVAETLMQFALHLTKAGTADLVHVNAVDSEDNEVTATFVVGLATPLLMKTCESTRPEPDNAAALQYMNEKLAGTVHAQPAQTEVTGLGSHWDFLL